MNFFIIKSPTRNIDDLVSEILRNNHSVFIQEAVWARDLESEETIRILEEEFDLEYSELQIGWRKVEGAEWACALSHHKAYQSAMKMGRYQEWICVIEDDVKLLPDFFDRVEALEKIKFHNPTIIQLFTRGKRFASIDKKISALNPTLFAADFPPGQTALYLINRPALVNATSFTKGMGDSDWPLWGRKSKFLMSYPWVGIEYAAGTTLPVYERTRAEYYRWLFKVLMAVEYKKWRNKGLSYGDYFYYLIYPAYLRFLHKLGVYKSYNYSDPNSIWLKK